MGPTLGTWMDVDGIGRKHLEERCLVISGVQGLTMR